jgi:hypothetical protein
VANAQGEATAQYMRAYYRAHSTRPPRISGAQRESKRCRYCGIEKPRCDFSVKLSGPRAGHLAAYCKPCTTARHRLAKERDPSIYRRVEWPSKLKRLYGLTVDDYYAMLTKQGGACALCRSTNPDSGSRRYKKHVRLMFDVDHCHITKKVRGLLCTRCNRLVGLANDSADTARKLVDYLTGA